MLQASGKTIVCGLFFDFSNDPRVVIGTAVNNPWIVHQYMFGAYTFSPGITRMLALVQVSFIFLVARQNFKPIEFILESAEADVYKVNFSPRPRAFFAAWF